MKTIAIIPAGGKGKRSGFPAPKQYIKFNGKELIAFTLSVFQKNKNVDEIVVAAEPEFFSLLTEIKKRYRLNKLTGIVEGGNERQDSVYNALRSLKTSKDDLILVHDAARPLLPQNILTAAILTAKEKGNALVCLPGRDTLIRGGKFVEEYVIREKLFYVQTPQIFKYSTLIRAMRKAYSENFVGTDESMLVKRLGGKINIVEGSILNFKITTKTDVDLFKHFVKKLK
ncbi:MAG: 2-C-methyl-D-erythritol 4-phosphate cytidylyltransferase [Ignavibacteriaceae bacterium]|nr:2-C-methyl-D-erythritol 4-phosphate cytidylyltransferase [Ignavibacteriaceae bacterium]